MLQWFARRGCGFDIVSGGELERVLAAGGDPGQIVFSGVGKTRGEIERALAIDVRCFNVESVGELEVLSDVASARRSPRRASACASTRTWIRSTHPYISTGLRAEQVRHRARGARPPRSRARRACPGSK